MAFVASSDLARARAFYEGVLGLRVIDEDPAGMMLDSEGALLRISDVGPFTPATYTVAGWAVADIAAAIADLAEGGVTFERYDAFEQDELGVWTAPDGARVAWVLAPDGNTLSLAQIPGVAPS